MDGHVYYHRVIQDADGAEHHLWHDLGVAASFS
jgi:hypothetical protein